LTSRETISELSSHLSCHPEARCHPEPGRRLLATEREGSAFAVRSLAEIIKYKRFNLKPCADVITFE
jgi:hypothetical protein